jgi:hypothetical protein
MRLRARNGSSATSGVAGSRSCGVVVRESVVVVDAGVGVGWSRRAGVRGGVGTLITTLGSRNVTCRSPPRRRCVDGAGAGMMNLKKRVKRKERMAMMNIRLVAMNTNKVWSSRAGRGPEARAPRSAEGFIGIERSEGGGVKLDEERRWEFV